MFELELNDLEHLRIYIDWKEGKPRDECMARVVLYDVVDRLIDKVKESDQPDDLIAQINDRFDLELIRSDFR